jgi:hypothetical protein
MLDEARRRSDTAGLANTTFIHGVAPASLSQLVLTQTCAT